MTAIHEDLEVIPQLFYQALAQVMRANSAPMLALWSEQDDVSYCDPDAHPHQGRAGLVAYWQRAVQGNSDAPGSLKVQAALIMMQRSTDMICTFMAEHIQIRENDRVLRLKALSTNIYRYEGQLWRMIHRHSGSPIEEK
ncbi:nuclear transport factor 2 family protein [Ktedonobacteria bacterium brp13]|nr:nuclear transport factor 2 family protein [Ktedonobacteria bacterium brp13]